jgi:beta-galactosidase
VPYIVPSENGARCDVSLLQLWDDTAAMAIASEQSRSLLVDEEGPETETENQAAHETKEAPRALRITSPLAPFSFSVQPYTTEDLALAAHATELEACARPFYSLNLDSQIQGIGGDDSWTACVHEEFLVPSDQRHHLAFSLSFPVVDA